MTLSLKHMIGLFEKMFGNHFWKNVIIGISRWGYDRKSEEKRQAADVSEEKWMREWSNKFHSMYDIEVKVKSLQESLAEAEGALDEMDDLRRKLKEAEEELEQ